MLGNSIYRTEEEMETREDAAYLLCSKTILFIISELFCFYIVLYKSSMKSTKFLVAILTLKKFTHAWPLSKHAIENLYLPMFHSIKMLFLPLLKRQVSNTTYKDV